MARRAICELCLKDSFLKCLTFHSEELFIFNHCRLFFNLLQNLEHVITIHRIYLYSVEKKCNIAEWFRPESKINIGDINKGKSRINKKSP